MSYYLCSFEQHYYPGKACTVYVGVGTGNQFDRWRLRFCGIHVRDIQEYLSEHKVTPEDGTISGGDVAMANCLSCGQPVDQTGRQLFLTCYPPNDEREDYWARIHVDCSVPTLLEDRWASKSA